MSIDLMFARETNRGCFDAGVREIRRLIFELRDRKRKSFRIRAAFTSVLLDLRTAGIGQPDELRDLVERLADRVIARAIEHLHFAAPHVIDRRMSARDHEREKARRQRERWSLFLKIRR